MTTTTYAALEICRDCVIYLANGEVPDKDSACQTAEHRDYRGRVTCAEGDACQWSPEWISKVWGDALITLGVMSGECDYCPTDTGEDCEPWFSMRRCDACHSRLGGDRQHATAHIKGVEGVAG